MSTISEIFASYRRSLDDSQNRYEALYTERVQNASEFYQQFFHKLIRSYRPIFTNPAALQQLRRNLYNFFQTDRIDFVAIDGTRSKDAFQDFITFFGGAYGAKGSISLEGTPPKVHYHKWAMNKDVSIVAYVPIPFAQLSDVAEAREEETFVVSDTERIDLSNIQTSLMQLAEIYLAFNVVSASAIDSPRLLMMDLSPSSLIAGVSAEARAVHLAGQYPYDRRTVDLADIAIAYAHPFNADLRIPTAKRFKRYALLVSELDRVRPNSLPLSDVQTRHNLSPTHLASAIRYLEEHGIARLNDVRTELVPTVDVRTSWQYSVSFFQNLCRRLFIDKDPSALIYEVTDGGIRRRRWLSPLDVKFLISVGIRTLIEKCWERKVLLTGVVKDSNSRYLSRNYLGVAKHLGFYPELKDLPVYQLPWTDRIFLETLPLCDDSMEAPWSTVEIDSAFMTLFLHEQPSGSAEIWGVNESIVANEQLFGRSLAQFFLRRGKAAPLMGHVVFIDRLIFPEWDRDALGKIHFETKALGPISLLAYPYGETPNVGQTLMTYLLSVLTRNLFPEVIGYPDPLHKADWGAKSVGRKVRKLIASSEIAFRSKPLSRTLRTIRESFRR